MFLEGKPQCQDSNSPFNDSNKNINRNSFSETEQTNPKIHVDISYFPENKT